MKTKSQYLKLAVRKIVANGWREVADELVRSGYDFAWAITVSLVRVLMVVLMPITAPLTARYLREEDERVIARRWDYDL